MTGVTRMTKRLDHGFRQKFENFLCFYFLAKSASKICLTLFQKVQSILRLQKTES